MLARENQHTPSNRAAIGDVYDYNRDSLVNSTDQVLPRTHVTTPSTALKLITAPSVVTMVNDNLSSPAVLPASLAGQAVWDTFTSTTKDRTGLTDTAAVKVSVRGWSEPSGGQGVVLGNAQLENPVSPWTLATGNPATSTLTNAAAHDAAIESATLDNVLGDLTWLSDFDLLGNGGQKSKQSSLCTLAVDTVFGRHTR